MDGWTDGRMDVWTDGRTDGRTDRRTDGQTEKMEKISLCGDAIGHCPLPILSGITEEVERNLILKKSLISYININVFMQTEIDND